ncbi:FAD-linked oxidase C-terminal domain-containing protein [Mesorhizobium sp.]|uniref:FAD-binding oxidoreductase n=1 Tax=Mesorhizobium sp. TaxID=1871066 RepID=UPI000FE5586F|nr:FAD-linked oxidase C-terminal domain-containing protein [Mesorhizobium sp.]RWO61824.1 MAG: FAD-binding protein [Mesorhizobium sp.]
MVADFRGPVAGLSDGSGHAELIALFGDRLVVTRAVREQHANTTTWVAGTLPDAVAFPRSTDEVQQAVRICARHRIPIIAFGAGTSFEGHVNAPFGGLCLDLTEMNRVIEVHASDFDCIVEPGVTRKQLNDFLRDEGLFFPVDPGADASLGGMASTRASGTTAVRYGTMKDNVLAMKAVLPNGDLIVTARRARKSSAGYDLTRLLVGAEGTLGVITELTLKLHGIPEAISAGVCPFPSVEACCDAAITGIKSGTPFARVELLDELQVRVCNAYSKLSMPEQPHLFLEFYGSEASVAEQAELFGAIAEDFGGGPFEWSARLEDRARLWQARHDVFWAQRSYRAGAKVVVSDVCVPISRLAECVRETKADIERSCLIAPIVGHVGDGNFHAGVLVMMDDPDEVRRAKAFLERLVERSLAMDGTCTGEHGIGEGKKHFMVAEHGQNAVDLMGAIKRAIDPNMIMNPGKIF